MSDRRVAKKVIKDHFLNLCFKIDNEVILTHKNIKNIYIFTVKTESGMLHHCPIYCGYTVFKSKHSKYYANIF